MNYYGIVDQIFVNSGIYGRKESIKELQKDTRVLDSVLKGAGLAAAIAGTIIGGPVGWVVAGFGVSSFFSVKHSPIIKLSETGENANKVIWIPNKSLANYYNIDNEEILYGLFKKEKQFKKMMRAHGGNSNLFIVERDSLPKNIVHYGGSNGIYSYGLYCEHPKVKNILLPMDNYKNTVKTRILEETIRVYASLGACEILIEDVTEYDVKNKTKIRQSIGIDADANYKKEILRRKKYATGTFDPEHAFDEIYFVPDYDSIMSVAKGRLTGNQIKEEFTETIHLSMGLDIDILNILDNITKFKYDRKWHFKVTFYDKNKM